MSLFHNNCLQSSGQTEDDDSYKISRSIRFDDGDTPYFYKKPSSVGNRTSWIFSCWVKRSNPGTAQNIWSVYSAASDENYFAINIHSDDKLRIQTESHDWIITNRLFTDPTAWFHLVVSWDSANLDAGERVRFYINGERLTDFSTENNPSLNELSAAEATKDHYIGVQKYSNGLSKYFDGYLADIQFYSGLGWLGPAAFGSFNSANCWNPKAFSIPIVNDGTQWSSSLSTTGGALANGANLFDGDVDTRSTGGSGGTYKFTLTTPISVQSEIEINSWGASGDLVFNPGKYGEKKVVSGASMGSNGGGQTYSFSGDWYGFTFTPSSGEWDSSYIKVDGVMLIDSKTDDGVRSNPNTGVNWVTAGTTAASGGTVPNSGTDLIVDALKHDGGDSPDLTYYDPTWGKFETVFNGILDNTSANRILAAGGQYTGTAANLGGDWTRLRLSVGHISAGIKKLRVWTKATDTQTPYQVKLLGSDKSVLSGTDTKVLPSTTGSTSMHWVNIPLGTATATDIKYIEFSYSGAGSNWGTEQPRFYWGGLEINDHVIVSDSIDNSYHLKFDETSRVSYLGKDSSGSGKIADATGALPIYNTTDLYGDVKGSGNRTDSDSSNLKLAIAGDAFTDSSGNSVNVSATNATISTTESRFYGSSIKFDGTGDYITTGTGLWSANGDATFEAWLWIDNFSDNHTIMHTADAASGDSSSDISIMTDKQIRLHPTSANAHDTPSVLVEKQWFHLAVVQSSSTRKVYINGVNQTMSAVSGNGLTTAWNEATETMYIGEQNMRGYFDGYMQDIRVYDKQKYTDNFKPPVRNDWAPVNLAVADALTDSPTSYKGTGVDKTGGVTRGNFATWNSKDHSGCTLSQGNLSFAGSGSGFRTIRSTLALTGGEKFYWETPIKGATMTYLHVGIMRSDQSLTDGGSDAIGQTQYPNSVAMVCGVGDVKESNTVRHNGDAITQNDVLMHAFDSSNGKYWIGVNGTWRGATQAEVESGTNPVFTVSTDYIWLPAISDHTAQLSVGDTNFGASAYTHTCPQGFGSLCTQRYPDIFTGDNINAPNKFFEVKNVIGNGSTQTVKYKFRPDLLYITSRNANGGNNICDVIRGNNYIMTHATNAQAGFTSGRGITFNADADKSLTFVDVAAGDEGLNGSPGGTYAGSSGAYIHWAWDAGPSAATVNTSGTIDASAAWVNTDSGFNILRYPGNGSDNQTLGHNLGKKPDFMIIKRIINADDWVVYHKDLTANNILYFNLTNGQDDYANIFEDTEPTSTLITLGSDGYVNGNNSDEYIAYLWSSIAGYSKFGSFVGSGQSDYRAPYIHLGFRPRMIILKEANGSSNPEGSWIIHDTERDNGNNVGQVLYGNSNSSSEDTITMFDVTSNGFKITSALSNRNQSGYTYVYAAWGDHPAKTARSL